MPRKSSTSQAEYEEADNGAHDPLVEALLHHLPAPGSTFTPEQRKLWLQILELAFKLIYEETDTGDGDAPA